MMLKKMKINTRKTWLYFQNTFRIWESLWKQKPWKSKFCLTHLLINACANIVFSVREGGGVWKIILVARVSLQWHARSHFAQ